MTDRVPPDDEGDASDWLASQFDPTGELPKQEPVPGAPVPPAAPVAPPAVPVVPPAAPVAPPATPVAPPAPPVPPQFPVQPGTPQQARPPQFPAAQQPQQPAQPQFPAAQQPQPPAQPQFPAAQPPPAQQPRPAQPQQPVAPAFPLPPTQPQQPVAPAFPLPQQPAQPPAAQPPAAQPPAQPPAAQPPAATPPAAGGFSWGLTPGAASEPPTQPARPTQPAQPPVPPAQPVQPAQPAQPVPPVAPATPSAPVAPPPVPPQASGTWFEPVAPAPAPTPAPTPAPAPTAAPTPPPAPAPADPAPLDTAIAGNPAEGLPPAAPLPFETGVLPDVAPDSRDAPPFWEPEPTQMMDVLELEPQPRPEDAPRQPFTRSVFPEGTELLPESAAAEAPTATFGAPAGETGAVSALDSLFGESQFKEYTGIADPNENPFARREFDAGPPDPTDPFNPAARPKGPPPGVSKLQRTLLIVLGSMLALIALVALFFLGIRLPALLGPAPAVTEPSASPTPSGPAAVVLGPVAPGTYRWDELLGGECLDPYESPWQDEYTVVDCANPHPAQMVRTSEFPLPENGIDIYPGEDELQTQALELCRGRGIFAPASSAVKDAVIAASYPVSAEEWDAGNRRYYCFVTRSSGEPITGDIALPQPAPPTPTPSPAPTP